MKYCDTKRVFIWLITHDWWEKLVWIKSHYVFSINNKLCVERGQAWSSLLTLKLSQLINFLWLSEYLINEGDIRKQCPYLRIIIASYHKRGCPQNMEMWGLSWTVFSLSVLHFLYSEHEGTLDLECRFSGSENQVNLFSFSWQTTFWAIA